MRALLLVLLSVVAAAAAPSEPRTRVLWIGTGWMAYHQFARQSGVWLERAPDLAPVEATQHYVWPLHKLLTPDAKLSLIPKSQTREGVLAAIARAPYTFVAVQVNLDDLGRPENAESFARVLDHFQADAKTKNARLVLVPYSPNFGPISAVGDTRLRAEAKRLGAILSPWWTALKRVSEERPDIPLRFQGNPTFHHGQAGVYLDLCVFFFAVTGLPPEKAKLPFAYEVMTPDAPASSDAKPAYPLKPATLDEATARYLQNVAWETVREATDASRR